MPNVDAALAYYDEFMPLVGFVREWETGYRATDWYAAQILLYPTLEDGDYRATASGSSTSRSTSQPPRMCSASMSGQRSAVMRSSTSRTSSRSTTRASTLRIDKRSCL